MSTLRTHYDAEVIEIKWGHVKEPEPSVMYKTISHYGIIKKLGAAGMGEVYLAQDTTCA